MAINLKSKKKIISDIKNIANTSLSAIIADSSNVKSEKIDELRKICRKNNIYIKFVRNTLIRRAIKDTSFECLKNFFVGQTLIAFSKESPIVVAKIFQSFSKENINFKTKFGAFEGKFISSEYIDSLVNLPSYYEAISLLINSIRLSSIGKLIDIFYKIHILKKNNF